MSTNDGIKALSEVTGLTRADLTGIWEQVKTNHALLQGCPRHNFGIAAQGARKRKCLACGGEAGLSEVGWYEAGLRHAEVPAL